MDNVPAAITWARLRSQRRAHAFADIDLSAGFRAIDPVVPCGRFLVSRLIAVSPDYVPRCSSCERACKPAPEASDDHEPWDRAPSNAVLSEGKAVVLPHHPAARDGSGHSRRVGNRRRVDRAS